MNTHAAADLSTSRRPASSTPPAGVVGVWGLIVSGVQLLALGGIAAVTWAEWASTPESVKQDQMFGPELGYFFLGIFAVPALIGFVCSGVGLGVRRRSPNTGFGVALAGLIIGCLSAAFLALTFLPPALGR
ncbi:hypothetical protein [Nocardioides montaniterrae]